MTNRLTYMLKRNRIMAAERARVHDPGPAPCSAAREVTMTELDRRAAAVIRGIRKGEVAVVSKHKRAVAMILPLDDELDLVLRDPGHAEGLGDLRQTFKVRARVRHVSALMHGRWYGKRYRRYRWRRERA